jgi:two-component system chemotaxis response regulator CheY
MHHALIVSSQDRAPLADILHSGGFEVQTATDCESARQQLESSPEADVVVADLSLPDGNWCTLLQQLRDLDLNAKLLICTQQGNRLVLIEVVQRGGEYALARSYAAETAWSALQPEQRVPKQEKRD